MPMPANDLQGKRFGRLVAIERLPRRSGDKGVKWRCRCDCDGLHVALSSNLKSGDTSSCGCLRKEVPNHNTHGMTGTKVYDIWCSMKGRCDTPSNSAYPNYGGRGITYCNGWVLFENFYADMGDVPDGMTLDRIDNAGDYEPENCRWASRLEQMNNTRRSRFITFNGATRTLAQWSRETGIMRETIRDRIDRYGWTVERALTTPVGRSP